MKKLPWKPWHEVVEMREDLRSGELPMSIFAADLYDVAMKKGKRPVYEDPQEFFALTYPTYNLRELARDVVCRLSGKNDKAVHQLELTYGGGKTHALITLYHLVHDPKCLPELPAVREFIAHIGLTPQQARVAVLPFDKLDVEKGMEVLSPEGETRWLKCPWSVLAFALAGDAGLKLLHPSNKAAERESAPAENLLSELIAMPAQQGLATLILMDEVLMYAREKVGLESKWREKLLDFFQYLTQAVTKVDRSALVASLLATDPRKSDSLGKELMQEIYTIFRREREQGVQPVVKEDVAEVLRRRFFVTTAQTNQEAFRAHVVAALSGIADLDEVTKKDKKGAEERFLKSYPFHPDLTEVFYGKWTQLESFQRTRGILRTFALALRDAQKWDEAPLISVNIFLGAPSQTSLGEAARELTGVATSEEYEGKTQAWSGILEGELQKARDIQQKETRLAHRELEQAVWATFLHSQPIGQKAATRDVLMLVGGTRPDKIELEKALVRWTEVSWFLDENMANDWTEYGEGRSLPKSWRLGSRPNLKQMHHDACLRISADTIEAKLLDEIGKVKSLKDGGAAAGVKVHMLPTKPKEIEDDGDFHFAILGPNAASDAGKPSAEARKFLEQTTSENRPRVFRNALVLAVPSREGIEVCKNALRDYLAWEEVKAQIGSEEMDTLREGLLKRYVDDARKKIPDALRQAYCIIVTFSDKGEIQAFRLVIENQSLFALIKQDKRARIQDSAVSAEALLPGGPYELWREGETSRRVKDLAGAFAQHPHLPKMLRAKEILDTLALGARQGTFVLRLVRPDRTVKTFWRTTVDEEFLRDPALEVVLPEAATIQDIPASLLLPDELPGLWTSQELTLAAIYQYFSGNQVAQVQREGYVEPMRIPKAEQQAVDIAVHKAVREGKLWLTVGQATFLAEEMPLGILTADARLQRPPVPIPHNEILPEQLPAAWNGNVATAQTIAVALAQKYQKNLPWFTVRETIQASLQMRQLECTLDSAPWPCGFTEAQKVKLHRPQAAPEPAIIPKNKNAKKDTWVAEAAITPKEVQDLSDQIGDVLALAAGCDIKFYLRVELDGKNLPGEKVDKLNKVLTNIAKQLQFKSYA